MKIIKTSVSKTDGTIWAEVDVNSLSDDLQVAYGMFKEAQEQAKLARESFEEQFRDAANSDGIRFGYNFGKLTIAKGKAPQAKSTPAVSLESFLGSQQANGRAA